MAGHDPKRLGKSGKDRCEPLDDMLQHNDCIGGISIMCIQVEVVTYEKVLCMAIRIE